MYMYTVRILLEMVAKRKRSRLNIKTLYNNFPTLYNYINFLINKQPIKD